MFVSQFICWYSDSLRAGRSGNQIQPGPAAEWAKASVCGRSLTGFAGSNPAGGLDICVLPSKNKRHSQDNQGKVVVAVVQQSTDKEPKKITNDMDVCAVCFKQRQKAKCSAIKTKKQVRIKYTV